MSNLRNTLVLNGLSTSLGDNPCINLCGSIVVGGEEQCKYCGRTQEQITHWQEYPLTYKKLINIELYDTHLPRQKITALAEEYNISFNKAKQIFAVDGYQRPN